MKLFDNVNASIFPLGEHYIKTSTYIENKRPSSNKIDVEVLLTVDRFIENNENILKKKKENHFVLSK